MADYPIVYVRGFAPTLSRGTVFHDAYYGFADTSVEKRPAPAPNYFSVEIFEGQLIRMLKELGYVDAINGGLHQTSSPHRSIWISRFYDKDFVSGKTRTIEEHTAELYELITETIPQSINADHKGLSEGGQIVPVILIAHSMGGLICRCLLQKYIPKDKKQTPTDFVHRLVTLGTPHKGIDSVLPSGIEEALMTSANIENTAIFREPAMRKYLAIPKEHGLNEIGWQGKNNTQVGYPPENCLCVIGSDHESYGLAKHLIGAHSDGLVKQSNAYIANAYYANVHRAHSGYQGIVNSVESYHNIRRFLFGNLRVSLWLDGLKLSLPPLQGGIDEQLFLNLAITIRGTSSYIHRREQTPCENGFSLRRLTNGDLEYHNAGKWTPANTIPLHVGFLDSTLSSDKKNDQWSNFQIRLGVTQHRYKKGGFLGIGAVDYPETTLYQDTVELSFNSETEKLEYRWIDSQMTWEKALVGANKELKIKLREAELLKGSPTLNLLISPWNQEGQAIR